MPRRPCPRIMAGITVLHEDGAGYAPTQHDVEEYAAFLGMELGQDAQHMWIAEKGLRSAVPAPWVVCRPNGQNVGGEAMQVFFFNTATGESTWEHPSDKHYRRLFMKEKAKQQPCPIGTLHLKQRESKVQFSVTGMGGDTLAELDVESPHETLRLFTRRLKLKVGGKMKLALQDGTLLTKADKEKLMTKLVGVPASHNGAEENGDARFQGNAADWRTAFQFSARPPDLEADLLSTPMPSARSRQAGRAFRKMLCKQTLLWPSIAGSPASPLPPDRSHVLALRRLPRASSI